MAAAIVNRGASVGVESTSRVVGMRRARLEPGKSMAEQLDTPRPWEQHWSDAAALEGSGRRKVERENDAAFCAKDRGRDDRRAPARCREMEVHRSDAGETSQGPRIHARAVRRSSGEDLMGQTESRQHKLCFPACVAGASAAVLWRARACVCAWGNWRHMGCAGGNSLIMWGAHPNLEGLRVLSMIALLYRQKYLVYVLYTS